MSRPYTIIEAGFANFPSIGEFGRRQLEEGQHYIALGTFDSESLLPVDPQKIAAGVNFSLSVKNEPGSGIRRVIRGEITNMPFADGAADEVIVPNLFRDPRFTAVERAAKEVARVLRPAGHLMVVETVTPEFLSIDELVRNLNQHDLFHINPGQERDPELVSQYSDIKSDEAYVAIFERWADPFAKN